MLTIALPKGALLKDSIDRFRAIGLDFSAFLDKSNRQLQITTPDGKAQGLLVRAQDVPVYVEYGQAQLGIVGYDVLREKQADVAQLAELEAVAARLAQCLDLGRAKRTLPVEEQGVAGILAPVARRR